MENMATWRAPQILLGAHSLQACGALEPHLERYYCIWLLLRILKTLSSDSKFIHLITDAAVCIDRKKNKTEKQIGVENFY